MAGLLREEQVGGSTFVRIDLPADIGDEPDRPDSLVTQLYSPSAVYCITPCTEDTARAVARLNRPAPVARWELPPTPPVRDAAGIDAEVSD
jgi:hypothetical protein